MSTNYQLTVKNDSPNFGSICLYQTVPNQDRNLFSLAWFSKACHPNTTVRFSWSIDYSFCWSESGILAPGVIFDATEQQEADPSDPKKNAIGFTKLEGAYRFVAPKKHPSEGCLGVYLDGNIAHGEAAVGVGMGGQAAFAATATPNYSMTFSPHPQYWVVFGTFQEGEVMDLNRCTDSCNIKFPTNVYKKELILGDDNTWR